MAYNQPEEFIFLSTQTASNSASLSFTSLITSQYPVYYIKIRSIIPATDTNNLVLTYSTNNGSTYLNSNYLWSNYSVNSSAGAADFFSSSDTQCALALQLSNSSTTTGLNGNYYLFGFGQSVVATFFGNGTLTNANGNPDLFESAGMNTSTTPINAIKFALTSGNITSGTIDLYGMVK